MVQDEFAGHGGSFLQDQTGRRIRRLPEWEDNIPAWASQPDMLVALAEGTVEQIASALPALGPQALTILLELETNGKARSTALDAILNAQGA